MEILVGRHFPPNIADAKLVRKLFGVRRLAVLLLHKVNRKSRQIYLVFQLICHIAGIHAA